MAGRTRRIITAAAATGLLVVAVAVVLAWQSGHPGTSGHPAASGQPPLTGYRLAVYLRHDITDEQQRLVESALRELRPLDEIQFESREQAWQKFTELFTDSPDFVANVRPEAMSAAFRITVPGTAFDCAVLDRLNHLPGVASVNVTRVVSGTLTLPAGPVATCR